MFGKPALLITICILAAFAPRSADAQPQREPVHGAKSVKLVRIFAEPNALQFSSPLSAQQLLITAQYSDGSKHDITDVSSIKLSPNPVVSVSPSREFTPNGNGNSIVKFSFKGHATSVPVKVTSMNILPAISFVNDVVPVLSRVGCNSGTCHGAAQGKGGFKLSLRGYAPDADFLSITRAMNGRRITREAPDQSLFLRKPLMEVPHRGGSVLHRGTIEYATLASWLAQGAPGPKPKETQISGLKILPGDRQFAPGENQRLRVLANFNDGTTKDVTGRALFATNDPAIASVSPEGLVKQLRSGESAITVKYMDKMAAIRVMAPFSQVIKPSEYSHRFNFIDEHVNAKLASLHIGPSGLCTDEEFLRRSYLDAIGTLPTYSEATQFLDSKAPDKRAKLVEGLLNRPEFGQIWALKFGDLFVLRREYMHRRYAMLMQQWLAEQFNANRPWDKIASDILGATGDLSENRGGLFYVSRSPQKPGEGAWIRHTENTAEMVATVFLGNRIQCAKCHNHPSEKFTQDDYYHFTALFQQVTGKGDQDEGVPARIEATANGDVRHPRTSELMAARPLDRSDLGFAKDEDRRVKFVQWLVKQDDFARNIINRFWARCFGSGIVEPVDDIRSTNPSKNEPLMNALIADLRANHFDLKRLMSLIMNSRTYQLSAETTKTNSIDTKLFSHYAAKRMQAEELADAVCQVTGIPDRFQNIPFGTRAIELADAEIPSIMLDTFGRPTRVQPLEGERNCSPAMSQALALLNGELVQQKVKDGNSILNRWIKDKKTDDEIIDQIFVTALSRRASSKEMQTLKDLITTAPKRDEGLQDVMWAVLNSKEFIFIH